MLARSRAATQDASSTVSYAFPSQGVLTPASETTSPNDGSANSRKRKWGDAQSDSISAELLGQPFTVKPHPSTVHDKPRTLKSIAILLRSDLPLAWLDRARPTANSLPESRLYEANIKVLDLERRMGNAASVLIAQLEDKRSYYAVEYDSKGLYVFFKLGSWVDMSTLLQVAVVSRPSSRPLSRAASVATAATDDIFLDPKDTANGSKFSRKKKLAIEALQSMIKRPSVSRSASISQPVAEAVPPVVITPAVTAEKEESAGTVPVSQEVTMSQAEMSPAEVLDSIRTQYLETLYLSKASTAYFAKGPLSRARANFQMGLDSTCEIAELIAFLKSLVLTTTVLDKKYTKGLPECISQLEVENITEDEAAAKKKRRTAKKVKLGKSGLYTNEDGLIKKWWENYDPATEIPGTSKEVSTRSRISQIRIRETQLQMMLILETLALERQVAAEAQPDADLPTAAVKEEEPKDQPVKTTPAKPKKQQDLPALINILVDRLSIWQSLSAVEEKGAIESVEKVSNSDKPTGITDKHAADVLRDFCVEVILPFFSARLPTMCDNICKKLGGPRIASPARPRPALKKAASTSTARPGAAIQRPARPESLRKVLSNERAQSRQASASRGPGGAISLMRSATAPILPGVKREASQTPALGDIPAFDSQGVSRGGVQKSKKFSQREVDLSFSSLLDPAAKKANIDNEIKDAISALKRPNRQLAGLTMAELAEKRTMAGVSQSRKARKPVRNPLFESKKTSSVLIEATPRNPRQKDMFAEPQLPGFTQGYQFEPDLIPPSSVSRIPSSGGGLGHGLVDNQASFLKATPAKRRVQSIKDVTPSRPPVFSRSVSAREPLISETPIRGSNLDLGFKNPFEAPTSSAAAIAETPMRPPSRKLFEARGQELRSNIDIVPSSSPPGPARRRSSVQLGQDLPTIRDSIFQTPPKFAAPQALPILSGISSPIKLLNVGRRSSVVEKEQPAQAAPLKKVQKENETKNDYDSLIGAWDNDEFDDELAL